jgi:hypothetical protein
MSDESLAEKRAMEILHARFLEIHNLAITATDLGHDV